MRPIPRSVYPWHIEDCDLVEFGDPELVRDLAHERQIGLHVLGSDHQTSLGLIAMRCLREGSRVVPLTLSIPETPTTVEPAQSNPRRAQGDGDDGA